MLCVMDGLLALVRMARRRLRLSRALRACGPATVVAACAAVAAVPVVRAAGHGGWALPALIAIVTGLAAAWILSRSWPAVTDRSAAIAIDERLGLEGRIASALALAGRADPFAQAAVEDGMRLAADASLAPRVRRAFRARPPGSLGWACVPWCVFVLLAWWIPPREPAVDAADVARAPVEAAVLQARAEQAEARVSEAVAAIEQSPEAAEELKDLMRELAAKSPAATTGVDEAAQAESREAEALERIATIEDRLARELADPELLASEAMRDALAALGKLPEAANGLAEALKTGRLDDAMKELERLAAEAAGSDPAKAAEAKAALEALAKAVENAAPQSSQALAKALEQAGLDPSLAKDPAAAMQALEQAVKSGAVTPEQAEAARKQAQAQQRSDQQRKELAKSLRECRSGSCQSAQRALSRQQSSQRMQAALQMAMRQCNDPSSLGWSAPWNRSRQGGGAGKGSGKGSGGKPGQQGAPRTDGSTEAIPDGKLASSEESAGDGNPLDDAAARDFVRAEGLPVGTSRESMQAVAAKVAAGLEEGTEEDPVPGRLKAAHKRYFEQWKKRLDATGTPPPAAPPGP
jgi:hypothetical protein